MPNQCLDPIDDLVDCQTVGVDDRGVRRGSEWRDRSSTVDLIALNQVRQDLVERRGDASFGQLGMTPPGSLPWASHEKDFDASIRHDHGADIAPDHDDAAPAGDASLCW